MELICAIVLGVFRVIIGLFWWFVLYPFWIVIVVIPVSLLYASIGCGFRNRFKKKFREFVHIWDDFAPLILP